MYLIPSQQPFLLVGGSWAKLDYARQLLCPDEGRASVSKRSTPVPSLKWSSQFPLKYSLWTQHGHVWGLFCECNVSFRSYFWAVFSVVWYWNGVHLKWRKLKSIIFMMPNSYIGISMFWNSYNGYNPICTYTLWHSVQIVPHRLPNFKRCRW